MSETTEPDGDCPRTKDWQIRRADWSRDQMALQAVRRIVFVAEQEVPEALEWDGLDTDAVHMLAEDADGRAIATARLLPSGQIGRMAVLRTHRGRGIGRALLLRLLEIGAAGDYPPPFLNAQVTALDFYRRAGFEPEGEVFDEAGIPHRRMTLADPRVPVRAALDNRGLGADAGLLRLDSAALAAHAVAALASQARRELTVLTPDLEPRLYDQRPFLDAVRRLALERPDRLPVRILLLDAEPAIRRDHRLIELARRLSSAVRIGAVPDELAAQTDAYLLADDLGYCLRRRTDPNTHVVDFAAPARVRALRRDFDAIWEQAGVHVGLRRLHL
jgi:predicted GNAT family N-acyltransferase